MYLHNAFTRNSDQYWCINIVVPDYLAAILGPTGYDIKVRVYLYEESTAIYCREVKRIVMHRIYMMCPLEKKGVLKHGCRSSNNRRAA